MRRRGEDRPFRDRAEACKARADGLVCGESRRSSNGNFTAPSADLIFDFRSSFSRTTRRDVAFIILCGSIARYHAAAKGWSGESEAALARSLVGDDFARVSDVAAKFVSRCWPQIEALAIGAEAAAA